MNRFVKLVRVAIGCIWVFHGLFSKILGLVPRHEMIVGRVLGNDAARWAILLIGTMEILLGLWVWSAIKPRFCAATQTAALIAMNTLELLYARDLLLAPIPMVAANIALLAGAWYISGRTAAKI